MNNTTIEIVFDIDEIIANTKNFIINFFPEDIYIKLIMVAMALVVGYGINRLFDINKKQENVNK